MMSQALLVATNDDAAVLTPILSGFGLEVVVCGYPEVSGQLSEQKFDVVLVDFEDVEGAAQVLQQLHESSSGKRAVRVALLSARSEVRKAFGQGANFVLYRPVSAQQAQASLRAAAALIKREKRASFRVPVQVPVRVGTQNGQEIEGILLDLSENGMDVLAAQPLCPSTSIGAHFTLTDGKSELVVRGEVAWANPNGEAGVRFVGLPESVRATLKKWVGENASEAPPQEPELVTPCKLTDLSLGGCYVETESPFPERSGISLSLRADDLEVEVQGRVCVMHPDCGMGIEFASCTPEGREQVEKFIAFLTSRPGMSPELTATPRVLNAGAPPESGPDELDDPLLELLRRHESLSQEEFLQELHQQRGSAQAASA